MRVIVLAAVISLLVGASSVVAESPGDAMPAGQETGICLAAPEHIEAPWYKGKACGDSCISKSKACHKAPGCACDGYMPEVPTDGSTL